MRIRYSARSYAIIAYREGISAVCKLIDDAEVILLRVTVIGCFRQLNSDPERPFEINAP